MEQDLTYFHQLGYKLVEINISPFSLIINGELRQPQLEDFRAVLQNFPLRYSAHGLLRLNLAYDPRHDLCCQIMQCQIEICRAMGASRLVYHSGLQALDGVRAGVRRTLLSDGELKEGAQREVMAFKNLASVAADAGVIICMENANPHQWEHNLIAQFGRPDSELDKYHARLRTGPIVRQLEAIGHPNVAMTLDIAHLHLAAHTLGFDYLPAISEAAPWARHLHLNDNFGRLDQGFEAEYEGWPFGEADAHLLPGWGSIPYHDVFKRLPDYTGDVILEIEAGFWDYLDEGRQTVQAILDDVRQAGQA